MTVLFYIILTLFVIYALSVVISAYPFLTMKKDELHDEMENLEDISNDDDRELTKLAIMAIIFYPVLNTKFAIGRITNFFKKQ
jgi:uncharacterized membrane protein